MRQSFQRRRDLLFDKLREIDGLSLTKPKGAFYFFPSVEGLFGRKYAQTTLANSFDISHFLLAEAQVAVVPGAAFGSDKHIRISYAYSERELVEAADRIAAAIRRLR